MCPDTLRGVALSRGLQAPTNKHLAVQHAVIQSNSYVGSQDTDCVGLVNDTNIATEAPPIIIAFNPNNFFDKLHITLELNG